MRFMRLSVCELSILIGFAILWIPGFRGMYFLSDDFTHLQIWGVAPLNDVFKWFLKEYTGFYRPLTALLWKLYYFLWGMEPIGYRLSNLILHTGCAIFLAAIANFLFPRSRAGLLSGLLFLFLPGNIFGVINIANLTGLLCSLFVLSSLLLYMHGRLKNRSYRIASVCLFVGALLTKELALCLPLIVTVWEVLLLSACREFTFRRWLLRISPYALVTCAYVLFRYIQFGHLSHSPLGHSNIQPVNLLLNLIAYTAASIMPWGLEEIKPAVRENPNLFVVIGTLMGALLLLTILKFRRLLSVEHLLCSALTLLSLLPVIRLFSPWNTYLPAAGSALFLGSILSIRGRTDEKKVNLKLIIAFVLLLLCITYSLTHQTHWQKAGNEVRSLLAATERQLCNQSGTFSLLNLPVELGNVPVFGGDWGFISALNLHGCANKVIPLAAVHMQNNDGLVETLIERSKVKLRLSNGDFFRLYTMDVLSKKVVPEAGYSYSTHGFPAVVETVGEHRQPNAISINMGPNVDWRRVHKWEKGKLNQVHLVR